MTLNSEAENSGRVSPPWLPLRDLGCLMPGALRHDKSESLSRAEHVSTLTGVQVQAYDTISSLRPSASNFPRINIFSQYRPPAMCWVTHNRITH